VWWQNQQKLEPKLSGIMPFKMIGRGRGNSKKKALIFTIRILGAHWCWHAQGLSARTAVENQIVFVYGLARAVQTLTFLLSIFENGVIPRWILENPADLPRQRIFREGEGGGGCTQQGLSWSTFSPV